MRWEDGVQVGHNCRQGCGLPIQVFTQDYLGSFSDRGYWVRPEDRNCVRGSQEALPKEGFDSFVERRARTRVETFKVQEGGRARRWKEERHTEWKRDRELEKTTEKRQRREREREIEGEIINSS